MITVVGSSNIDFITYVERLPSPGETVTGTDLMITPGGKGANQAVAAARLGSRTVLLTKLGLEDRYAGLLTDGFEWAGVDLSRVVREPEAYCGCALIMVDGQARNIISIVANANGMISPRYIEANREVIEASRVLVVEFGVPMESVARAVSLARAAGVRTVVNPAPVREIGEALYRGIDILVPNEHEAAGLCGAPVDSPECLRRAADWFHARGVAGVIVTLGERGAFLSDGGRATLVPGFEVATVDTTGAGDAFVGGLACALDEGGGLEEAAAFASAAAALSVTRKGTARSMPGRQEVDGWLSASRR